MSAARAPAALLSLGLLALGLPVACSGPDLATAAARPDAVEARQIADTIARGGVAAVTARLDESQRSPDPENVLNLIAAQFPQRDPIYVHLVGYQVDVVDMIGGSTTTTSTVTFESNYGGTYVITTVVLRGVDDGPRRILGLHAQALPSSLAALNNFSLRHKGFVQYAFLLAMIAVAVTTVTALVSWFRRRRVTRRKWWWLLAILVGAFKFTVNWTTGAFAVQALTVQLLGLSVARDGVVGPWFLSFSIPAGAIAFLINARRARLPAPQEAPAPAAPG